MFDFFSDKMGGVAEEEEEFDSYDNYDDDDDLYYSCYEKFHHFCEMTLRPGNEIVAVVRIEYVVCVQNELLDCNTTIKKVLPPKMVEQGSWDYFQDNVVKMLDECMKIYYEGDESCIEYVTFYNA